MVCCCWIYCTLSLLYYTHYYYRQHTYIQFRETERHTHAHVITTTTTTTLVCPILSFFRSLSLLLSHSLPSLSSSIHSSVWPFVCLPSSLICSRHQRRASRLFLSTTIATTTDRQPASQPSARIPLDAPAARPLLSCLGRTLPPPDISSLPDADLSLTHSIAFYSFILSL